MFYIRTTNTVAHHKIVNADENVIDVPHYFYFYLFQLDLSATTCHFVSASYLRVTGVRTCGFFKEYSSTFPGYLADVSSRRWCLASGELSVRRSRLSKLIAVRSGARSARRFQKAMTRSAWLELSRLPRADRGKRRRKETEEETEIERLR